MPVVNLSQHPFCPFCARPCCLNKWYRWLFCVSSSSSISLTIKQGLCVGNFTYSIVINICCTMEWWNRTSEWDCAKWTAQITSLNRQLYKHKDISNWIHRLSSEWSATLCVSSNSERVLLSNEEFDFTLRIVWGSPLQESARCLVGCVDRYRSWIVYSFTRYAGKAW